MQYLGLLLCLIVCLLIVVVKYMGALIGLLYFACAAACGIFSFVTFCAIKTAIEDEDPSDFEDWS